MSKSKKITPNITVEVTGIWNDQYVAYAQGDGFFAHTYTGYGKTKAEAIRNAKNKYYND
jgi:hypothetical protein